MRLSCSDRYRATSTGSAQGLWAKGTEQTNAGPVKIDENYVRESLMEPQAKLVNGFPPSMPTFKGQLKDAEISAIVSFLKSLSK